MYAVIETGGKQYRVEVGTQLEVELLDVEPGQSITLDRVLLVADGTEAAVGRPVVENAEVEARVVGQERGDKVVAFKYKPKARRRVIKGHRQELTVLRIADIRFNGRSAAADMVPSDADKAAAKAKLEEAAARQAAEDAALAARLAARADAEPASKGDAGATVETAGEAAKAEAAKPAKATAEGAKSAKAEAAKSAKAEEAKSATTAADDAEGAAPKSTRKSAKATAGPTSTAPDASAPAPDEAAAKSAPKRSRTKKDE